MIEKDNSSVFSWTRARTTEELGDFVTALSERRSTVLESVTLED